MYEKLLKTSGLTKNESKVYLTLLKIGKAKTGRIVKEAGVSGGKIYETLYKLIDKGLVESVTENGVKHFIANEPETLLSYIKEKETNLIKKREELEKILPDLKSIKREEELDSVFLIKGFKGISTIVYDVLKDCNEIKIMGVTSSKNVKYNNFWRGWHRERVKLKKTAKMIFSDRNTDYWKFFKNLSYTAIKELTHFTPSAIMIIDDHSFIFSYGEDFTCIHIDSKSITTSFSEFFESLWKVAKK